MHPDDYRHGTTAGYAAHLTSKIPACRACKDAKNAYDANARKQTAYGRWQPFVDAQPARDHVLALRTGGTSMKRIAAQINIEESRISYLLYGAGDRTAPRRIRPEFSDLILSTKPDPRLRDSLGARRRLQALTAMGYNQRLLGNHLGMAQARVWSLLHRPHCHPVVTVEVFERIADVYEALSMTFPPEVTRGDKMAVTKAKRLAERMEWPPPLAWDDIDDPRERPNTADARTKYDVDDVVVDRVLNGERLKTTYGEKLEVMRRATERGISSRQICSQMGWKEGRYTPGEAA